MGPRNKKAWGNDEDQKKARKGKRIKVSIKWIRLQDEARKEKN
jgi:hypothetical protein